MGLTQTLGAVLLRRLDPETAHGLALKAIAWGFHPEEVRRTRDPILATTLAGLELPNPVGLAAGFDKDARVYREMLRTGFGFVECGTVTPRPQAGNPRPRLFRLREDRAVINRMGFNNEGLEAFAPRIRPHGPPPPPGMRVRRLGRRSRADGVVVANIGANKASADRVADYIAGLDAVWAYADAVTVNVSSPNTPGLRALQSAQALDELGERLGAARTRLRAAEEPVPGGREDGPPLFLKVAPDLDADEIEAIAGRAVAHGFDALIVSNTTLERPATLRSTHAAEAGGLSGAPLFDRSTRVLAEFAQALKGTGLPLVGVGGIASGADAYAKIRAGASAVQLYTALVYGGPGLLAGIKRDLAARLKADGFGSVAEAVGTGDAP